MDVASLAIQVKTGDVQKGAKELDKLTESGKDAERATHSLAVGYGVAAGAITAAAFAIGRASVQAAIEAETASNKMVAVLKATGYAAGKTKEDLDQLADSMAESTKYDDESIRNASAVLLTFRNVQGDAFNDGIKLAADLASVLGTDLNSAALQVGKALNDPVLGVTSLARAGVQFSEVQKDQIKLFVETNQLAKAQDIILGELRAQVGGTAEAMNTGITKAVGDQKKAWDELFEALGKSKEVQGVTISFAEAMAGAMNALTKEINKTGSAWAGFVDFVFKPFDLNLLGFDDGKIKNASDEMKKVRAVDAAIEGRMRQEKAQADDVAAVNRKKAMEEQAKIDKKAAEDKRREEERFREAVINSQRKLVLDEFDARRKAEDEAQKYREQMREKDIAGWVAFAEARVTADFDEANQLAKDQIKKNEEEIKRNKEMSKELEGDLKSAFMMAFQASKDPARAFVDGLANAVFSRVSASLASALADAAMKKIGGGAGGDLFGSLLGMGGGLTAAFSGTSLGSSGFGSGLAYGNMDLGMNFEGGGFTGAGARSGGLDGKGGFAAMLHPNETVIDHTKGGGSAGIVYAPVIQIDSRTDRGEVMRIVSQAVQNGNAKLVDSLQRSGRL